MPLALWIVALLLCVLLVSCLSPSQFSWHRGQFVTSARALRACHERQGVSPDHPCNFLKGVDPWQMKIKRKAMLGVRMGMAEGKGRKWETQASHNLKLSIYMSHGVIIWVRISELGFYQLNQRNRWPIHNCTARKGQNQVSFWYKAKTLPIEPHCLLSRHKLRPVQRGPPQPQHVEQPLWNCLNMERSFIHYR